MAITKNTLTVHVEPEQLGSEATVEQAAQMVALLNNRGWRATLTPGRHALGDGSGYESEAESALAADWDECLDILSSTEVE